MLNENAGVDRTGAKRIGRHKHCDEEGPGCFVQADRTSVGMRDQGRKHHASQYH
jgi:hypothetical protein